MAVVREITRRIEIDDVCSTKNSFLIYRGDSVKFSFTFFYKGRSYDITSATTARIFAKKIYSNGKVQLTDSPLFSVELELNSPTSIEAEFTSLETAGSPGTYLLSIILLDSNLNTFTTQTIPFELYDQGYAGVYQPSDDYRDELLKKIDDFLTVASELKTSLATMEDTLTDINNMKTALNSGEFIFKLKDNTVRAFVGVDENNNPYWDMTTN